jgi:dynein light chain LC8-type
LWTTQTDNVQFDERKGATWHCIVGRNFGSFVTHGKRSLQLTMRRFGQNCADIFAETKHFIYFYLGHCAILLFKTQ